MRDAGTEEWRPLDWITAILIALSWAVLVFFGPLFRDARDGVIPPVATIWQAGAGKALGILETLSTYLADLPLMGIDWL